MRTSEIQIHFKITRFLKSDSGLQDEFLRIPLNLGNDGNVKVFHRENILEVFPFL
jgi:hypothetical protein